MTDPILQVYLDEAAKRAGCESWAQARGLAPASTRTSIGAHARTLQELGWKPPVDPMLVRAREIAGEVCSGNGSLINDFSDGTRDDWAIVQAALIALREGMGE